MVRIYGARLDGGLLFFLFFLSFLIAFFSIYSFIRGRQVKRCRDVLCYEILLMLVVVDVYAEGEKLWKR